MVTLTIVPCERRRAQLTITACVHQHLASLGHPVTEYHPCRACPLGTERASSVVDGARRTCASCRTAHAIGNRLLCLRCHRFARAKRGHATRGRT